MKQTGRKQLPILYYIIPGGVLSPQSWYLETLDKKEVRNELFNKQNDLLKSVSWGRTTAWYNKGKITSIYLTQAF